MSIAASLSSPADAGWLGNAPFDLTFIFGTTVLAVVTGWVVVMEPSLFVPVLMLDIWLLGQHRVVSTFTRLCFSKGDMGVPPLILIFRTINFHHYIVDGIIWRSKKSKNISAAAPDGQPG
jgi:hypothetical protein